VFDWDQFEEVKSEPTNSNNFNWDEFEPIEQNNPSYIQSAGIGAKTNLKGYGHGIEQLAQMLSKMNPTLGMYAPDMAEEYQPFQENRQQYKENLDRRAMANRQEYEASLAVNPKSTLAGSIGSDVLLGGLGMPGGAIQAPIKGAGYLGAIAQAGKTGAKYGAAESALMGGLQYEGEDESRLMNSAISGLLGGGIGGAAGAGIASMRPSNIAQGFRGKISNEDLARNLEAARGTETSLGRVTEDTFLRDLSENILPYLPGSGAKGSQSRTAAEIERRAAGNLEGLSGGRSLENSDIAEDIQSQLQKSARSIRGQSGKNYKAINDLADSMGINVSTSNLSQTSSDILQKLRKSPALSRKQDPALIADLEFYSNAAPESLESLSLLRGELGDDAWKKLMAGERHTSGQYTALNKAVSRDIDQAIEESGNTELKDLGREAKEYYKKNVVPLNDRSIKKFVDDPNLTQSENIIATFVKHGPKQDRVKRLKQLTNHLDEETMDKLRFAIFSDAEGNASAQNITKVLGKLGKNQIEELIPNATLRNQMDQLSNLARMNPEAFNQMYNPKTGFRNQAMEAIKTYGPTAAASIFNPLLGAGAVATGRITNKFLTSEKVREALVSSMLKGQSSQTGNTKLLNDAIVKMLTPAVSKRKESK